MDARHASGRSREKQQPFARARLDSLKALKAGAVVKVFPSFQERWEEHMQTGGPEEGHDVRHLLDAMLADARPSFIPASQQALTQHRCRRFEAVKALEAVR